MSKKIALITGISGQDGAYLAKFLLKKNYTVIGTDRRSARSNNWRLLDLKIFDKVIIEDLDITEINNLIRIFQKFKELAGLELATVLLVWSFVIFLIKYDNHSMLIF